MLNNCRNSRWIIGGDGPTGTCFLRQLLRTKIPFNSFAPRPFTGPHKLRDSLPLVNFLRNRLKYALTNNEVTRMVMQRPRQRHIKIDGKVCTDPNYPAGFIDVITSDKNSENFRLIYDVKVRSTVHRITPEEAKYKLLKVKRVQIGPKKVPYILTHDERFIRDRSRSCTSRMTPGTCSPPG